MTGPGHDQTLHRLRERFGCAPVDAPVPISLGRGMDAALGGGLARGALHEIAGLGAEIDGATAGLFVAACLARTHGPVLWVLGRSVSPPAPYPPALAAIGLHPDRVIYAQAWRPAAVLLAMEDALRHAGLAGVVGEFSGRLTLTASRRLQLAAESRGTPAFLLRRSKTFDDPVLAEPCAAVTRWRVGSVPSPPPFPDVSFPGPEVPRLEVPRFEVPGLGPARWELRLIRRRGGEAAAWLVEAPDAQGCLGVVADLADRPAAPQRLLGAA